MTMSQITAKYIGDNFEYFQGITSVAELKSRVYERSKKHITNKELYVKGAKMVDWDNLFKALQNTYETKTQ